MSLAYKAVCRSGWLLCISSYEITKWVIFRFWWFDFYLHSFRQLSTTPVVFDEIVLFASQTYWAAEPYCLNPDLVRTIQCYPQSRICVAVIAFVIILHNHFYLGWTGAVFGQHSSFPNRFLDPCLKNFWIWTHFAHVALISWIKNNCRHHCQSRKWKLV